MMFVFQCETDDPESVAGAYISAWPMGPMQAVLEPVAATTLGPTHWRLLPLLEAATRSASVMAG